MVPHANVEIIITKKEWWWSCKLVCRVPRAQFHFAQELQNENDNKYLWNNLQSMTLGLCQCTMGSSNDDSPRYNWAGTWICYNTSIYICNRSMIVYLNFFSFIFWFSVGFLDVTKFWVPHQWWWCNYYLCLLVQNNSSGGRKVLFGDISRDRWKEVVG